jgi:hypothetical protein
MPAPPPPWHPEPLPPLGFRYERDGQSYVMVGTRLYVTVRHVPGRTITMTEWRTECPNCGTSFVTKSLASRPPLNRRCEAHRAPGRRVENSGQ